MPRGLRNYAMMPMLTFGANATDVVSIGTGTPFDLDPFACLFWVMPTTLTTQRCLLAVQGSTSGARLFRLSGTTGDIMVTVLRVTTSTSFITNNTPLSVLGAPVLVGFSFNSAASGNVVRIVRGDLRTPMTECTYGTATNGSGALTALVGTTETTIGNNRGRAAVWQGSIGPAGIWNADLSVADFEFLRRQMISRIRGFSAKGFYRLGEDAVTVRDYSGSGNTGTITGATISRSGLILPARGILRLGRQVAYPA